MAQLEVENKVTPPDRLDRVFGFLGIFFGMPIPVNYPRYDNLDLRQTRHAKLRVLAESKHLTGEAIDEFIARSDRFNGYI